ncbi:MAG: porin family protein [Bacteroidales bacterium]|nr:porin family protein [Bacteroidales bacterium]
MKRKVLIALALIALLSFNSYAQEKERRFGFELSGGPSFTTREIDDAGLKTGFGFEGTLHYRFMPHLGVYGGWGWNRSASDDSFAGNDICFEETGYIFGLNFSHPVNNSGLSYFLRAGGLFNHIETENRDGDIINDTGHGFGFQLAGGIDIKLGSDWSLSPGIKFNSLSRETEYEGTPRKLFWQYISAGIGVSKKF